MKIGKKIKNRIFKYTDTLQSISVFKNNRFYMKSNKSGTYKLNNDQYYYLRRIYKSLESIDENSSIKLDDDYLKVKAVKVLLLQILNKLEYGAEHKNWLNSLEKYYHKYLSKKVDTEPTEQFRSENLYIPSWLRKLS